MLQRNTTNESFKLMRQVLQNENIRNNEFPLYLINKSLENVDVLDVCKKGNGEFLEPIIQEAKENIWYYFREILRVPTVYGNTLHKFELTPLALQIIWLFDSGFSVIIRHPKDYTGVTTVLAGLLSYMRFSGIPYNRYDKPEVQKTLSVKSVYEKDIDAQISKEKLLANKSLFMYSLALDACLPSPINDIISPIQSGRKAIEILDTSDFNPSTINSEKVLIDIINDHEGGKQQIIALPDERGRESTLTLDWIYNHGTKECYTDIYDIPDELLEEIRKKYPMVIDMSSNQLINYRIGIN